MKYTFIRSVLVLGLKANSCLSPSHPFRMDSSSSPSCVVCGLFFGFVCGYIAFYAFFSVEV